MPYATTPDAEVYYESHGDGEPLLLLHGGGGNHAIWYQQVPHFSKRYRVITMDLPGFGLSKVKGDDYGMGTHPAAIEAVLDHAGVERGFMVSQSLGGYGMLNFVVKHPQRVVGYVMTSTLGPIGDEVSKLHQQGRTQVQGLSVADFLLTKEFQAREPAKVELFFAIGSFNEAGPGRDNNRRGGSSLHNSVSIQQMRDAINAGVDLTIIEGGADLMVYPPAYQRLRELLPEARIQPVEGAPHSDYWENPERFNAVVDQILDRVYQRQ